MDESLPPRAAVDTYFKPTAVAEDGKVRAQFRGRQLVGVKVPLPPTAIGLSLSSLSSLPPHLKSSHPEESSVVAIEGKFQEVTCWGHDYAPTKDGNGVRIVADHFEIMRAIHGDDC